MEGGSGESYLQDMVLVPASLVQGILGINGAWDWLDVKPAPPNGWRSARAGTIYRGKPDCIEIQGDHVEKLPHACREMAEWTSTTTR
jgi:hypothetical protein